MLLARWGSLAAAGGQEGRPLKKQPPAPLLPQRRKKTPFCALNTRRSWLPLLLLLSLLLLLLPRPLANVSIDARLAGRAYTPSLAGLRNARKAVLVLKESHIDAERARKRLNAQARAKALPATLADECNARAARPRKHTKSPSACNPTQGYAVWVVKEAISVGSRR